MVSDPEAIYLTHPTLYYIYFRKTRKWTNLQNRNRQKVDTHENRQDNLT